MSWLASDNLWSAIRVADRGTWMTSFWTKAAQMAAQAGNDGASSDVIRADFGAEQKRRLSIRRDPPPLKAAIPTEDPLRLRLAEELEYARRMLNSMGDELASDVVMVGRHLAELQTIDIVGQMLGHIAAVVRSSDPPGAVDAIGMGALKARLMRTRIL
jgi:hypothetical protein